MLLLLYRKWENASVVAPACLLTSYTLSARQVPGNTETLSFLINFTILSDEDILGILPRPPRVRGCTGLRRRSLHGRTQATRSLRWST